MPQKTPAQSHQEIERSPIVCPFHIHFRKSDGLWHLCKKDVRNSVSISCGACSWPSICTKTNFLEFYISDWMNKTHQSEKNVTSTSILRMLEDKGFQRIHIEMIHRALGNVRKTSSSRVLESDQKIEDYIRHLNKNDQLGVVLYSNGDLIVPGPTKDDECLIKHYTKGWESKSASRHLTSAHYWDALPNKKCKK